MKSDSTVSNDFPAWFPPTVVKELRQGLRSPGFTRLQMRLPILMAVAFAAVMFFGGDEGFISSGPPSATTSFVFWVMTIACSLLIVIQAASSMKNEISTRAIDFLLLSNQTPWRIICGKWCFHMTRLLLMLTTLLPFIFIRYYYGSIDLVGELCSFIALILACAVLTAIAIWVSCMSRLMRTLFTLGTVLIIIVTVLGALSFSATYLLGGTSVFRHTPDFANVLLGVYNCAAIGLCFLLLATRWISDESSNTSVYLRLLIAAPFLPLPLILLFSDRTELSGQTVFGLSIASFIFIMELTSYQRLLPVHFAKAGKGRFSSLKKLFLLPGFSSASLALALFTLGAITLLSITYILNSLAGNVFAGALDEETTLRCIWFMATWWFSLHGLACFINLVCEKLKNSRPLIYFISLFPLFLLTGVFVSQNTSFLSALLPWGAMTLPFQPFHPGDPGTFIASIALSVIVTIVGLAMIPTFYRNLAATRKQARETPYLNDCD